MNNQIIKDVLFWVGIALGILLLTIGISELAFGDLTGQDTLKPLWVVVPVIIAAIFVFKYFWNKNSK